MDESLCGMSRGDPEEAVMFLDVFYLAIGILSVALCWSFVKACDRL